MPDRSVRPGTLFRAFAITAAILVICPAPAFSMHISEGILPVKWAGLWFVVAAPFVLWGLWDVRRRAERDPSYKAFLGLIGAAVFIISCMPIPVPVAGSCSHPCGTGLAAIMIGPGPTIVVTAIALSLQALFMAHGGLSTLGGNILSMGVAGALIGYGSYRLLRGLKLPIAVAAFVAGALADWATYTTTAFELATALHGDGSLWVMFAAILIAFVPTQLPLGIFEGFLSAGAYQFIRSRRPELLKPITAEPAN